MFERGLLQIITVYEKITKTTHKYLKRILNLCLWATQKQMLSLKFMTRCVYAQASKQHSHPPHHLPPSVPLHPLFDLLLLQIFGRFLPLRSSGLLQLHLPRVPSTQQTLSHPVHICPPCVPLCSSLSGTERTGSELKLVRCVTRSWKQNVPGLWVIALVYFCLMCSCVGYLC